MKYLRALTKFQTVHLKRTVVDIQTFDTTWFRVKTAFCNKQSRKQRITWDKTLKNWRMNTAVSSSVKVASQVGVKKLGVRNIAKEPIDHVVRVWTPCVHDITFLSYLMFDIHTKESGNVSFEQRNASSNLKSCIGHADNCTFKLLTMWCALRSWKCNAQRGFDIYTMWLAY